MTWNNCLYAVSSPRVCLELQTHSHPAAVFSPWNFPFVYAVLIPSPPHHTIFSCFNILTFNSLFLFLEWTLDTLGGLQVTTVCSNFISNLPTYPILLRRFVWNFFRLENEHLNNCGEFRAVRDISVAPLNADDQTLLEQMMDQDDGVRNRQKNRPWKYSQSISLRRPRLASQYVWLPLFWNEFPSGVSTG